MIYPTRLAVLCSAAVAPIALTVGIFAPAFWTAGLALLVLLLALAMVDALTAASLGGVAVTCEGPRTAGVGESFAVTARARFPRRVPASVQFALGASGPVAAPFGFVQTPSKPGAAQVCPSGQLADLQHTPSVHVRPDAQPEVVVHAVPIVRS